MKRILITGGTGFFGKSIIDCLSWHPDEVERSVLSRHGFGTAFEPTIPVQILTGDVRTFDTDNAIRQAFKCGAEKFMMVSSGGVYGRSLA